MNQICFTTADYLETIRRELAKRETTYPKIIAKKKKKGMSNMEIFELLGQQNYQCVLLETCYLILKEDVFDSIYLNYDACLKELKREIKMRKKYYPRLIYFKRITPETAEREMAVWAALVDYFTEKYVSTCLPS